MAPQSAHSVAATLGYPYIRGEGKPLGNVWMSRFQKSDDQQHPALYVGWDEANGVWVTETDPGPQAEKV